MPAFSKPRAAIFPLCRLLLPAAALLACLASARSDAVLDLTFDDPQGLLKSKPEGVERLTSEFARSTATIASGHGGRALPQIAEGPAAEREGKAPDARVKILSEPAMGTPGFVRFVLDGNAVARSVTTGIIPQGLEHSPSSFVSYENGRAVINGGFDFFFRITSDSGSQPKLLLSFRCGVLGVNLSVRPVSNELRIQMGTGDKLIDLDGDGVGDKAGIERKGENAILLEPDRIYHGAVVFHTSPDGACQMTVCLEPGAGPLDPSKTIVTSTTPIWILEGNRQATPEKIVFGIGQSQEAQTFDLAKFRIFKPAPEVFPGLGDAK